MVGIRELKIRAFFIFITDMSMADYVHINTFQSQFVQYSVE